MHLLDDLIPSMSPTCYQETPSKKLGAKLMALSPPSTILYRATHLNHLHPFPCTQRALI